MHTEERPIDVEAPHIHPSMQVYRRTPEMASEYDTFYRGTHLLTFDTEYLDGRTPDAGALLDLGCGTGRHVVHFARRGFDVTGIDFSPYMISECRQKLQDQGLKARLVLGDIADLSHFADNSFRYCTCMFSTLGLIRGRRNRLSLVREVRRILKPGGFFFFHVHNRLYNITDPQGRRWLFYTYVIGPLAGLQAGDRIMDGYRDIPDMFLHIFSSREIRALVRGSGLSLVDLFHLGPTRDRLLEARIFRSWRANGFLVTTEKPKGPAGE